MLPTRLVETSARIMKVGFAGEELTLKSWKDGISSNKWLKAMVKVGFSLTKPHYI